MSIKIQKNISLSKYTSFKIGGAAKWFCVAESIKEIKKALEFAEKNKLNIFVLGGGSNLLISDKGFDGLVIRIMNYELRIKNKNFFTGSGLSLMKLVNESVKYDLTGLEWAAGIPGTVGGAIANNAGAYRKSMADIVEEVEILDISRWFHSPDRAVEPVAQKSSTGLSPLWSQHDIPPLSKGARGISGLEIRKFTNKQCQFSYRNSIFKKEKKFVILSAVLKLSKGNHEESKKTIAEILKSRRENKQAAQAPLRVRC